MSAQPRDSLTPFHELYGFLVSANPRVASRHLSYCYRCSSLQLPFLHPSRNDPQIVEYLARLLAKNETGTA